MKSQYRKSLIYGCFVFLWTVNFTWAGVRRITRKQETKNFWESDRSVCMQLASLWAMIPQVLFFEQREPEGHIYLPKSRYYMGWMMNRPVWTRTLQIPRISRSNVLLYSRYVKFLFLQLNIGSLKIKPSKRPINSFRFYRLLYRCLDRGSVL